MVRSKEMKRVKRVTAFISAILLASNNCHTYVMAADLANESIGESENSNGEIYDQGDIFENPDDYIPFEPSEDIDFGFEEKRIPDEILEKLEPKDKILDFVEK